MRITRQFTLLKALVLVAFVAIVCSSCIKADFSIVVDANGTGSISGEMAISKKLGEIFGEESGDPEEFDCESASSDRQLSIRFRMLCRIQKTPPSRYLTK